MNVYNIPTSTHILAHDVLLLERSAAPSASISRVQNCAVLRHFRAYRYCWWVNRIREVYIPRRLQYSFLASYTESVRSER